jgi:hypothetical protein
MVILMSKRCCGNFVVLVVVYLLRTSATTMPFTKFVLLWHVIAWLHCTPFGRTAATQRIRPLCNDHIPLLMDVYPLNFDRGKIGHHMQLCDFAFTTPLACRGTT